MLGRVVDITYSSVSIEKVVNITFEKHRIFKNFNNATEANSEQSLFLFSYWECRDVIKDVLPISLHCIPNSTSTDT